MRLKVLDRLFLKGIIGPYLLSFFVVEFVLIMQFLWQYIDDLLGQGYSIMDFAQLIFYFGLVVIPMALPLTVLLSSVMVYGEKAEKYELTAMKSSGVSLMRMLRPGLIVAVITMLFSLFASNVLKPEGNRQYLTKMRAMKTNKLTYTFEEKVFNTEFENYSIWIDEKDKDGRTLKGIKIYDHTDPDKTITNYIHADSALMYTTPDNKYLVMELYDGVRFKELRSEVTGSRRSSYNLKGRPVNRITFASLRKSFELAKMLNLSAIDTDGKQFGMLNAPDLYAEADSLLSLNDTIRAEGVYTFEELKVVPEDTANAKYEPPLYHKPLPKMNSDGQWEDEDQDDGVIDLSIEPKESIIEMIRLDARSGILSDALANARAVRDRSFNRDHETQVNARRADRFLLYLHQQFSWALVCLLFLFIGGSAGAIVRKGGFGLPMLVAIIFYMMFIMMSISGERVMRSGALSPFTAGWLPCFVLAPFAIVLTYWALLDKSSSTISLIPGFLKRKKKPKSKD